MQVTDTGLTLPTDTGPILHGGYTPAQLSARTTDPNYSANYASFKGFVDARLSNLNAQSDQQLAKFAKAAALLDYMGKAPTAGGAYSSYADASIAAIGNIDGRNPRTNIFDIPFPPSGAASIVTDSTTLQVMSEAYDLLRGSSSFTTGKASMQAKIDDWADAIGNDYYLTDLTQGESNWATKAGAALVTTGLALRDTSQANTYLSQGTSYINASLAKMVDETGYNREGHWYTNYSLNNLLPAAIHVKAATGVDWVQDIKPMVEYSLKTRLPDGSNVAFEEGLRTYAPSDVLAAQYSGEFSQNLAWAEQNTNTTDISSNFANQQIISTTRFLHTDLNITVAPTGSPTSFHQSDEVKSVTLKTSFLDTAVQANLIAATDYASTQLTNSRHNSQNFADMIIYGNGKQPLVTSTGGNKVTSTDATDRANFMNNPMWKNIPLVDGASAYITDSNQLGMKDTIDSSNVGIHVNQYLDAATVSASNLAGADSVSRTTAIVNSRMVAVKDDFQDSSAHDYSISWHGRGTRTTTSPSATSSQSTWIDGTSRLTSFSVANQALAETSVNRIYAEYFGGPAETIESINLAMANSNNASALTVFAISETTATAPVFTEIITNTSVSVGIKITEVSQEHLILSSLGGTNFAADKVLTDASFASITLESAEVIAFGVLNSSLITYDGDTLYSGDAVDISAEYTDRTITGVIGDDTLGSHDYFIGKTKILTSSGLWKATFNGISLDSTQFEETADGFMLRNLDGNGQFLIQVPEPSTNSLILLGSISLLLKRRR